MYADRYNSVCVTRERERERESRQTDRQTDGGGGGGVAGMDTRLFLFARCQEESASNDFLAHVN